MVARPGGQNQEAAAGLIGLDEDVAGGRVEVAGIGGELLERVVGQRGEHGYAAELGDLVLVSHRGTFSRVMPSLSKTTGGWNVRLRRGVYEVVKRAACVMALLLIGLGCSPSRGTTPVPAPTRSACATATRFGVGGAANEIRGVSRDAQLWGLALGPGHVPPRTGDELKIVWRMTGTGPLRVSFTAPTGRAQPLLFGPDAHTGSSYHRPGDEWGTGFRFTASGCWHMHFARDDTSADVWLNVLPDTSRGPATSPTTTPPSTVPLASVLRRRDPHDARAVPRPLGRPRRCRTAHRHCTADRPQR